MNRLLSLLFLRPLQNSSSANRYQTHGRATVDDLWQLPTRLQNQLPRSWLGL